MGIFSCKKFSSHRDSEIILESKIKYIKPPQDSNVSREVINGIKSNLDNVLLVDGIDEKGIEYKGSDIWEITARLATGLMKSDIKLSVGEPVLLTCNHSIREKLVLLASLFAGGAIMGTAPSGYDHIRSFAAPTKPRVIITCNEQFDFAKRLRKEVDGMKEAKILLIDKDAEKEIDLTKEEDIFLVQDLMDWPEKDEKLVMECVNSRIKAKEHNSMLMMTSGSTGQSKVVPWTHEKQLSDIWSMYSASQHGIYKDNEPMLPINKDTIFAGDLPLDQGPGVVVMLWSLIFGAKFVVIEPYKEEKYWRDVMKFKLTACIGSSTFTYRLLKKLIQWINNPPDDVIDISSMKFISCAGAKVFIEPLMEQLRPIYKNLQVTQFYGATEIGFMTMLTREDARKTFNPVGNLWPGVRAKVVDLKTGATLGPEEEGEMLVKSPSLFHQYIPYPGEKMEDLMANRFDKEEFYRTGDLVHYDKEHRFFIHSRLKDTLYLDQDWKTTPAEIETVLNRHPAIEMSVVVGVPNPEVEGCVLPKAFIKLKSIEDLEQFPSTNPEEYQRVRSLIKKLKAGIHDQIKEDIIKFTSIDLAEQKQLHGGIRIVDEFPRIGGFNKIDRLTLQKMD